MMPTQSPLHRWKQEYGFSYIEVVVAVVIISLALIPAIRAVTQSISVSRGQQQLISATYGMFAKMEYVKAQPYNSLYQAAVAAGGWTNPTSYSDAADVSNRCFVYLAPYDGDNEDSDNDPFTGGDAGLLWIKVELEDKALAMESLASQ